MNEPKASLKTLNKLKKGQNKIEKNRSNTFDLERLERVKDKKDRKTTDLVIDRRTRKVLSRLRNTRYIKGLYGCISTGKEANVYYAKAPSNAPFLSEPEEKRDPLVTEHLAVKIYKTSILVFKDRQRYITGEHRFKKYSKNNPRKMIALWAEKEYRNLLRLNRAGIPSPVPLFVRNNVLVMTQVGIDGKTAPRLKDAILSASRYRDLYVNWILLMRKMYHECCLIHADLSEYNVLYMNKGLYFIDVSQSVERNHPNALPFLMMDCINTTDYFIRKDVLTLNPKQLFDFVMDERLSTEELVQEFLDYMKDRISEESSQLTRRQTLDERRAKIDLNSIEVAKISVSKPQNLQELEYYEEKTEKGTPMYEALKKLLKRESYLEVAGFNTDVNYDRFHDEELLELEEESEEFDEQDVEYEGDEENEYEELDQEQDQFEKMLEEYAEESGDYLESKFEELKLYVSENCVDSFFEKKFEETGIRYEAVKTEQEEKKPKQPKPKKLSKEEIKKLRKQNKKSVKKENRNKREHKKKRKHEKKFAIKQARLKRKQ